MNVFICWSGTRSKRVANALQDWLPRVLQALEPWISVDIAKGAHWSRELLTRLHKSPVGIVCLTRENIESRWLYFEAGSLTRSLTKRRVCTFLLPDLSPEDVPPPLNLFQPTGTTKDELRRLVVTLNEALTESNERPLSERSLVQAFERNWPDLDRRLRRLAAAPGGGTTSGDALGELASEISSQLSKAGLNASTVASGAGLSDAPLEVQLRELQSSNK